MISKSIKIFNRSFKNLVITLRTEILAMPTFNQLSHFFSESYKKSQFVLWENLLRYELRYNFDVVRENFGRDRDVQKDTAFAILVGFQNDILFLVDI